MSDGMQKGEEVTPVTPASPDAAGQPQPLVPASAPSQGASGANPAVEPGLTAQGAPRPPHPSTTGQTQPSEEKTELQQKLADLRDLEKVSNKLAELETFTWTTAEQSVLNLQIVLRRKYEGAVLAASVATEEATGVGDTARKAVYAAIVVALVGWFVVVVCVTWLTLNPDPLPFPPIQSVWPASRNPTNRRRPCDDVITGVQRREFVYIVGKGRCGGGMATPPVRHPLPLLTPNRRRTC